MKAPVTSLLASLFLGIGILSAKTIKKSLPGEMVAVTFDESRTSEQEVRTWLQLEETAAAMRGLITLGACPPDDARYSGCNPEARVPDPKYAEMNVERIRKLVLELRSMTVPARLEPVRTYLLEFEEFWLWSEQEKLAFLRIGDADVLAQPWGRINPELNCHQILTDLRNAKKEAQRWFVANYMWTNCMLDSERKEIGNYPTKQWQAFLKAEGISIRMYEDIP